MAEAEESKRQCHGSSQTSTSNELSQKFVDKSETVAIEERKDQLRQQNPQYLEPPRLMHLNSLPMPSTSKGENGRPKGEPESFSDYNIIYDHVKRRSMRTE